MSCLLRILSVLLVLAVLGWPQPGHAQSGKVDINSASAAELDTLPGIGPGKARAIIEDRERNGPFQTVHDLERISGIGRATVLNLADRAVARPPRVEATDEADEPAHDDRQPQVRPRDILDPRLPDLHGPEVDINQADEAGLLTLPGIGPSKAWAILEDRRIRGPFESCDDLVRVVGVGPATVANAGDRCVAR